MTLTAKVAALDAKERAKRTVARRQAHAGLAVAAADAGPRAAAGVKADPGPGRQNVQDGSPAADAGFERGDVIVEGEARSRSRAWPTSGDRGQAREGKPILFRIQRQDASLFLTVTV